MGTKPAVCYFCRHTAKSQVVCAVCYPWSNLRWWRSALLQGFFQPIAGMPFPGSVTGLPRHVELLHRVFSLCSDPHAMLGVSRFAFI